MQNPLRKRTLLGFESGPCCCEVMVLTTTQSSFRWCITCFWIKNTKQAISLYTISFYCRLFCSSFSWIEKFKLPLHKRISNIWYAEVSPRSCFTPICLKRHLSPSFQTQEVLNVFQMFHGFTTIYRWSLVSFSGSFGTAALPQRYDAVQKFKKIIIFTLSLFFSGQFVTSPWGVSLGTSFLKTLVFSVELDEVSMWVFFFFFFIVRIMLQLPSVHLPSSIRSRNGWMHLDGINGYLPEKVEPFFSYEFYILLSRIVVFRNRILQGCRMSSVLIFWKPQKSLVQRKGNMPII